MNKAVQRDLLTEGTEVLKFSSQCDRHNNVDAESDGELPELTPEEIAVFESRKDDILRRLREEIAKHEADRV